MEKLTIKDVLPLFKEGMVVEYVIAETDGRTPKKLTAMTTLLKDNGSVRLLVYHGELVEDEYSVLDYKKAIEHYNKLK